jgi:PAS domain S-box-containing protein
MFVTALALLAHRRPAKNFSAAMSQPALDQRVHAASVAMTLHRAPISALAALATAVLVSLTLDASPGSNSAFCCLALLALGLARYGLLVLVRASSAPFLIATFLLGVLWGLWGGSAPLAAMMHAQPLLPALIFAALVAEALATLTPIRGAAAAFIVPLAVSLASSVIFGESGNMLAGVAGLSCAGLLLLAAQFAQRATEHSLRWRFSSEDLAKDLAHARATAERTDCELKREIVEHVKAEARLDDNLHWVDLLRGHARVACVECKPDSTIIGWNAGAANIFGYSPGEAIGRDGMSLLFPETRRAALRKLLQRVIRQPDARSAKLSATRKDGKVIVCDCYARPRRDPLGRVTSLALVAVARRDPS